MLIVGLFLTAVFATILVGWKFSKLDCNISLALKTLPKNAFHQKKILIIGASSGIGEAIAYICAKQGAHVIAAARRVERLHAVCKKCKELGAQSAEPCALDVLDTDSHAAFAETLLKKYNNIDILVNNAGRSQRSLAEETSMRVHEELFQLNVIGAISIAKAFLPSMLKHGKGSILVTSSVAGLLPTPVSTAYAASKHAIQGYFHSLRTEVGTRGINITLACPGPVRTEITKHAHTAKEGVALNAEPDDANMRITAERCAELMLTGVYHKMYEVWIAYQPILFFVYLNQYLPTFARRFAESNVGPKRVEALRRGDFGYNSIGGLRAAVSK